MRGPAIQPIRFRFFSLRFAAGVAVVTFVWASGLGCIGVSAKPAGGLGPGSASAVKRCRALRAAPDGTVDDLEDGDTQITKMSGRDGYWFNAKDPKGSTLEMQAEEAGAGGAGMAMHISGTTVPGKPEDGSWGVQLGLTFLGQGQNVFYDASPYAGIAFRAKAASGSARKIRFKIADLNTHPDGHICTNCWNHFGADLTLAPEWKEYRVAFAGASQELGWGNPRPQAITPSKLIALNWQVGPAQSYDIWIDDVTFLDCDSL